MTTTYQATATREGRWWLITVPAVNGVTQAKRLADAELMARELVAITLDVELDEVAAQVRVADVEGINVAQEVEQIARAKQEAARLDAEAARQATKLAHELAGAGLPMRDIGAVLGVSHQRAHQLVNS